jgi:hypothetical protein
MTILKWIAAVALIGSVSACIDNNAPYGGNGYGYAPGAYNYNQQPTYHTQYANGQAIYNGYGRPSYYGYGQPSYYGYAQPSYYGYGQPSYYSR